MKITRNDRVVFKVEGDERFDLDFYRKAIAKVVDWPGEMTVEVSTFEKTIIVRSMTTIDPSHGKIDVPSDQTYQVAPTAPSFMPNPEPDQVQLSMSVSPAICASCKDPIVPTPNGYIHLIDRGRDHEAVKLNPGTDKF